MTSFPQLSNFLFSPRHRRGLSRFGYRLFPDHAPEGAVMLHDGTTVEKGRGTQDHSKPVESHVLSFSPDLLLPGHVGTQHIRYCDRAVLLLIGLHHGYQCPTDRSPGAI